MKNKKGYLVFFVTICAAIIATFANSTFGADNRVNAVAPKNNGENIEFNGVYIPYKAPRRMTLEEVSRQLGIAKESLRYGNFGLTSDSWINKSDLVFYRRKEQSTPLENALAQGLLFGDSVLVRDVLANTGSDYKVNPNIYFRWEGKKDKKMLFYPEVSNFYTSSWTVATPLMMACVLDELMIAKDLLKAGADPLLQDSRGNTAVHYAAMSGSLGCLELFKDQITLANRKNWELQPIHYCALRHNINCLNYAVQNGADITALTWAKENVVQLALTTNITNQNKVKEFLIAIWPMGADFNNVDKYGTTPLMSALNKRAGKEIFEKVLQRTDDVAINVKDESGN